MELHSIGEDNNTFDSTRKCDTDIGHLDGEINEVYIRVAFCIS